MYDVALSRYVAYAVQARESQCWSNCMRAMSRLRDRWPDLRYVEGFTYVRTQADFAAAHGWLMLGERLIDPTYVQLALPSADFVYCPALVLSGPELDFMCQDALPLAHYCPQVTVAQRAAYAAVRYAAYQACLLGPVAVPA